MIKVLEKLGLDKNDLEEVAGGVVSDVWAADHEEMGMIVLKCTKEAPIEAPKGFFNRDLRRLLAPAPKTHRLDYEILEYFQGKNGNFCVPEVLVYDEKEKVTVMKDFRSQGYEILQNFLVRGELNEGLGTILGKALAELVQDFSELEFEAVEASEDQFEERFEELEVNFGYSYWDKVRPIVDRIRKGGLIPPDTHPKNIAVKDGKVPMMFDFGRSVVGDSLYVLPNFAAHVVLAVLGGAVEKELLSPFVGELTGAYQAAGGKVDEEWFVKYLLAELAHRGVGVRWLDKRLAKRDLGDVQTDVLRLVRKGIVDEEIGGVDELVREIIV